MFPNSKPIKDIICLVATFVAKTLKLCLLLGCIKSRAMREKNILFLCMEGIY